MKQQSARVVATALLITAVVSVGCGSSSDQPSSGGTSSTTVETTAEPTITTTPPAPTPPQTSSTGHGPETAATGSTTATAGGGEVGTSESPVPVGDEAQVGPWRVRVLDVVLDADDIVYNHSEFNEPPQSGNRYVLIELEAVRTGEETAAFWTDTYWEYVGSGGALSAPAFADIPDPISETPEAAPGASVSGYLVFDVPFDQIAGGRLRLSEAFSFEDVEAFFAVD